MSQPGQPPNQPNDRDLTSARRSQPTGPSAGTRALVALLVALVAGGLAATLAGWTYGVLLGWMGGAGVFVAWMWISIWPMGASDTAAHAVRDDPGRATFDLLVLVAAVASLGAVALLLQGASGGAAKSVDAALSVLSVALAWATVHTVFTTRYARLYYTGQDGGMDFNEDVPPQYADFAYAAFTVGMTFQVSDTDVTTKQVRHAVLRHALLSYLFGAVIIATTINLVAGLGK